jgi:hypothetical protein
MKEPAGEIWCPSCRTIYAKIWRVPVNESHWTHETEPSPAPVHCSVCESILERKRGK